MMAGLTMKYFVLKPRGDDSYAKASRAAMRTYAKYIREENKELCDDLRDWADSETPAFVEDGDMGDEKKLSERVGAGDFEDFYTGELYKDSLVGEILALEKRLAVAERILSGALDAIPGEAIGKKQLVAFLENTHD